MPTVPKLVHQLQGHAYPDGGSPFAAGSMHFRMERAYRALENINRHPGRALAGPLAVGAAGDARQGVPCIVLPKAGHSSQ